MAERDEVVAVLVELDKRVHEWMKEGLSLQEQLVKITFNVLLDERALTEKEQGRTRKLGEELE